MLIYRLSDWKNRVHILSLPTRCTIFIIYLLLLHVSGTGHGHLQEATSFLDIYSVYWK